MKHILIHGLGQKASSWNETISYMTGQDTIICPELSLFIKEKDASYSNLYTAFSEYCNNISGPLNLCGLSLGAVLALNYAIDNPKKVNSLVLIAAQYEMPKTLIKLQNIVFKFIPEKSFKSMGLSRMILLN
ncbi:alpha/beta fold hydrolase [Paraclostridium dentum]|uniref:alpha/beta fold hydrolase n=1 Tax=Paraclostridium dentum TaxID=2662455 RepID=UPI003B00477B